MWTYVHIKIRSRTLTQDIAWDDLPNVSLAWQIKALDWQYRIVYPGILERPSLSFQQNQIYGGANQKGRDEHITDRFQWKTQHKHTWLFNIFYCLPKKGFFDFPYYLDKLWERMTFGIVVGLPLSILAFVKLFALRPS